MNPLGRENPPLGNAHPRRRIMLSRAGERELSRAPARVQPDNKRRPLVLGRGAAVGLSAAGHLSVRRPEGGEEILIKNVYQWDIDSVKNLATFQEESLKIDRQAERNIYRRGDNVTVQS